MKVFKCDFNILELHHETDIEIELIDKDLSLISVLIDKFGILVKESVSIKDVRFKKCKLVFEGVAKSRRSIAECKTNSITEFEKRYIIDDGPLKSENADRIKCELGAVLKSPHGWIQWGIEAVQFKAEVEDNDYEKILKLKVIRA